MSKTKQIELAEDQFREGNDRFSEYLNKLEGLAPEYRERESQAMSEIDRLQGNAPELDLSVFSDELSSISDLIGGIGGEARDELSSYIGKYNDISQNLGRGLSETRDDVSRYLTSGDDYIASMLKETEAGADKYVSGYRRMANQEMPGVSLYRDQEAQNLGASLQQLKNMGVSSPNAIAQILSSSNQNKANIALEASRFKTDAEQRAYDAELKSGITKAGAYSTAAGQSQNSAGIRLSQGAFESGVRGQQAGIVGAQTDIESRRANIGMDVAGQQAGITDMRTGMAESEFNSNMAKWLSDIQWEQQLAMMFNPLDFESSMYGSAAGIFNTQKQSGTANTMQAYQNRNQAYLDTAATLAELSSSYNK